MMIIMSATAVSLAERFSSQEYISFKDIVEKASLDNKLVIKNKNVVLGKQKVKVPNFVGAKDLVQYLEAERVKHLLAYNNVYEKILVSDKPQVFKTSYDKLVTIIANLELLIDEIHAFVDGRNSHQRLHAVRTQLDSVTDKINKITLELQASGVLDMTKVKELVALFHEGTRLHTAHVEAKQEPYRDYVIYDLPSSTKQPVVSASRTSKRSGLSMLNKVKPNIKKLMIDKLDIPI